ncbi:hypothetical protein Clacol_001257 [Clathrus columnatus]|uniref:MABP domain-containing protein n=1 Tax=Clathrus columnatus TaxID=1419009 RepID=A0AAV5A1F4_9AGAM|nr:hypothetical protein Clacol_001257 [Clathrus columnatus]
MSYISGIIVHYGNPQPPKTILELNGGSADLNKDFQGQYVYLVAERTADANLACNRFEVIIQDKEDALRKDLSKGTGDGFRYLLSFSNVGDHEKVTDVRLLRLSKPIESPPAGFVGMTSDINKGRKGDFLYLIWTTGWTNTFKSSGTPYPVSYGYKSSRLLSAQAPLYVSGMNVAYGTHPSQEPDGALTEINHNNDDVNAGFNGSYVWLVPTFTSNAKDAVTGFNILIQEKSDSRYKDLARGSGGDYRYCVPLYDIHYIARVTNVRLLRSDDPVPGPPRGYQRMSIDINKGRGHSYLYLIWMEAVPNA